MSNIIVSLTTTKYVVDSDGPVESLYKMDFPVCAASVCIGAFASASQKESLENFFANACKTMAKEVIVDTKTKTVLIGDEGDWLVEYTTEKVSEFEQHFFQRWDQTHSLLFEFTAVDFKNEPIFCIKGIWAGNEWSHLDIGTKNSCIINKSKMN